jgi:nitrous oxidase accessory protein NosD
MGMKKLLLVFCLLIVVSALLVGISSAAIVYVPDNYSSIQEAINAASADDTVIVRNGTYSENIVLNNSLSLIGDGLPTVDAEQNGSAIRITVDGCA